MEWVRQQLEQRKVSQGELGGAIGLTESQISKVMGGSRKLSSKEADAIRRFFGYRLPDDPADTIEARIYDRVAKLRDDQKRAVALYLEALMGIQQ